MRVFTGLPLPEHVKEKIKQFVNALQRLYPKLNYVKPEGLHITIHFFGELPESGVQQITKLMDDPSLKRKQIQSGLSGSGQFPPKGNPKVIFIDLKGGQQAIADCKQQFDKLILPAGFPAEEQGKPFVPHITIARNKREKLSAGSLQELLIEPLDFAFDKLVLYKSVLSAEGADYSALKTVMFT